MNKKRIFFLGAAVLIFSYFTWFVPEPAIYHTEIFFGLFVAIAVGLLFYQGVKPDQAKEYTPEDDDNRKLKRGFAILGSIVATVITIACVYFINVSRGNAYIKKNSIVVEGTILDGNAITTIRKTSSSTNYELQIQFEADGKKVTQAINVNSDDWNRVGKEMPILVAYAKGHPDMCKPLFNAQQVEKYTNSDKIKMLKLAELETVFHNRRSLQIELQKQSLGWNKFENEDSVEMYYNTVYWTILTNAQHLFYVTQVDSADNFNSLLAEARKNMQVVYDSLETDPKHGALFKNENIQVRFLHYQNTKMVKPDDSEDSHRSPYMTQSIPHFRQQRRYEIGVADKSGIIILPGDLKEKELDRTDFQKMIRESRKKPKDQ